MPYQNLVVEADPSEIHRIIEEVCESEKLEYSLEYDGDLYRIYYRKRMLFVKRVQMEVARVVPLRMGDGRLHIVFWLSDLESEKSQRFYQRMRMLLNRYIS